MMDPAQLNSLLADLVRIESINPDLVAGGSGEERVARYVVDFLRRAGLEAHLLEVAPRRFNAVGVLRGRGGGRSLMLNGHLDTVGVEGMAEPFAPRIDRGRLYGRGSMDMKGGVAAALAAAASLAHSARLAGDLVVAAVADEEHKSLGTRALLEEWRADAAIVTEPTGLEVALAHKGFAWAEISTLGKAAHGSRPQEGVDAIALMGRVLLELERLQARLSQPRPHSLLGHGSVHASLVRGGQELSSYPASCHLDLERRLLPGETAATLEAELGKIVEELSKDPRFRAEVRIGYSALALETPAESPVARTLLNCAQRVAGGRARAGAASFWTDAALLSEAGIPSVLFGPGGAGLHSAEEYVSLEDIGLCALALEETAREFCGM